MKFIFEPYPYIFTYKNLPLLSLIAFICIFIIGYIFRPFNVSFSEHKFNYLTLCLIQAFLASLIFFFYFNVFNFFYRKWKTEKDWNIFKESLTVFLAITFAGVGAFLNRNVIYDNPNNFSLKYFVEEILHAWLIGGLLYVTFTVINHYRLSNLKNEKKPNPIEDKKKTNIVSIKTQVKSDNFDLDLNRFLIAKADGNYVEIYSEKADEIDKKLIRLSLKDLEKQLKLQSSIIRTHRTFLVNIEKIENVAGNALGYELKFENLDFRVPVSRGNIKEFDLLMNQKQEI